MSLLELKCAFPILYSIFPSTFICFWIKLETTRRQKATKGNFFRSKKRAFSKLSSEKNVQYSFDKGKKMYNLQLHEIWTKLVSKNKKQIENIPEFFRLLSYGAIFCGNQSFPYLKTNRFRIQLSRQQICTLRNKGGQEEGECNIMAKL
jgi:hypothetical protein